MPDPTIKELSEQLGMSAQDLCQRLEQAGVAGKSVEDQIDAQEKRVLLDHLNPAAARHAADRGKITLKRKTQREIQVKSGTGGGARGSQRSKQVVVEVRRQRTYAKLSAVQEEQKRKEEEEARLREEQEQAAAQEEEIQAAEDMPEELPSAEPGEESEVPPEFPAEALPQDPPAKDKEQAGRKAKHRQQKSAPREETEKLHVATDKSGRRRRKSRRRKLVPKAVQQHGFQKPTAPIVHDVEIPESISVAELAQRMSVKASEVIKQLMNLGTMVTINQIIDQETAMIVVEEMGHKAKPYKTEEALEQELLGAAPTEGERIPRAPVVTVMGHVDHGKTSLLDFIRDTRVTAGEAGGITQHIGAYQVDVQNRRITFLDTPGHEAFTAMRARGASITDIVVIVAAADDGVMPQTREAIKHARMAQVPIIVAVNKIDKDGVDPEKTRQEFMQHDVIPESLGGDVQFFNISAKTGQGVNELLEGILLQADILELTAWASSSASGAVLESRLDKGRGPVASVLVQNGVLRKGDVLLSGREFGRIRAMLDDRGKPIGEAGPSSPVEVLGLSGTPNAGDEMIVVEDEKKAREICGMREGKYRETRIAKQRANKMENLLSQIGEQQAANLNLLIKADVQGSAEALVQAVEQVSNENAQVKVISHGVGGITESDVNLAITANGIVIGFNVRADSVARKRVETEQVDVRYYSVIYDVIDDVRAAVDGLSTESAQEKIIGMAEVREVYHSPKFGDIAGCMVSNGLIRRNNPIRVLRDNVVIYEGELESLRRFKEDVNEVKSGVECGVGVKNYTNVQVGDQIEVFERREAKQAV